MMRELIILTIGIVGVSGPQAYAASVTWDGGGGDMNWHNALNWSADTLPGPGDDVVIPDFSPDITITYSLVSSINSLTSPEALVISGGSLEIAAASTINAPLTISGGVLTGAGDLTVAGLLLWTGGQMSGAGRTIANGGMHLTGPVAKVLPGRRIDNLGTAVWDEGRILAGGGGVFNNLAGAVFDVQVDELMAGTFGGGPIAEFNSAGTLRKSAGVGVSVIQMALNNTGTVEVQSGTLLFGGGYTQTAGSTILNGGDLESTTALDIQGGSLSGDGTIFADVSNGGQLSPGFSPGLIETGDYSQGATGTFNVEIGGLAAGTGFDQLVASGVTLGGALKVNLIGGFAGATGDTFTIIDNDGIDAVIGTFDGLAEGAALTIGAAQFEISYAGGDGNDVVLTELVSDPVDLLASLIDLVIELNLQQGINNSLDTKLDAAVQALEDMNVNNDAAACNSLAAFINQVQAQSGTQIPEADASALIAIAQAILEALGCQ